MPRPAGSGNKPKAGFSFNARISHLQELQKKLAEHTQAATGDLAAQLRKVYDDITILADANPPGESRDLLLKTRNHVRAGFMTLTGEDITAEKKREAEKPAVVATMIPASKPNIPPPQPRDNSRPNAGASSSELLNNLERHLA